MALIYCGVGRVNEWAQCGQGAWGDESYGYRLCSILPIHGNGNQSEDRGRNRDSLDHPTHLAHQAPKGPSWKETGSWNCCHPTAGLRLKQSALIFHFLSRITDSWSGLDWNLKLMDFQPWPGTPCHGQGHLPLDLTSNDSDSGCPQSPSDLCPAHLQ